MNAAPPLGPGRRRLMTAVLSLTLALVSGCGGGHVAASGKATTSAGRARVNPHYGAPGASISIVHPIPGSTVLQPLRVKVVVRGFKLDPIGLDKAPRKGWGNLHFRMDGGKY